MRRLIVIVVMILLSVSAGSCRKQIDGFDLFVVKAGENPCNGNRFHPYSRESLDFEFKVDGTWIWDDISPAGVNGWSKIAGFAESIDHKKNRIVLAVRYESGKIICGAYGDADGVGFYEKICELQVGGTYFTRISIEGDYYVIRIDGYEYKHLIGTKHLVGVRLNPHVGGDYTLGHDWRVLIKWIK